MLPHAKSVSVGSCEGASNEGIGHQPVIMSIQIAKLTIASGIVESLPLAAQQFLALRCNGRQTLEEIGSAHPQQMLLKA